MNMVNSAKAVHMSNSEIDLDVVNSNIKMINNMKEKASLKLHYDIMLGRFLFSNLPSIKTRSIRLFLCAPFQGIYHFWILCKIFN
jgi:hypothetical protein